MPKNDEGTATLPTIAKRGPVRIVLIKSRANGEKVGSWHTVEALCGLVWYSVKLHRH
jgi:hypothetical protein